MNILCLIGWICNIIGWNTLFLKQYVISILILLIGMIFFIISLATHSYHVSPMIISFIGSILLLISLYCAAMDKEIKYRALYALTGVFFIVIALIDKS